MIDEIVCPLCMFDYNTPNLLPLKETEYWRICDNCIEYCKKEEDPDHTLIKRIIVTGIN